MRLDAEGQARWLRRAALCLLLLVGVLLGAELFIWRPGYAVGDESIQMRMLLASAEGQGFLWHFLQGCLHRWVLHAWLGVLPFGMGSIHGPALVAFALELWALHGLAQRWSGRRAAWGALIVLLASASTWLRVRSLLSFEWQPLLMLAFAWAALLLKTPWQGMLLGAASALLLLDYESGVIALPFVALACAQLEPAFRRRLPWVLAGGALGALALAWCQWPLLRDYAQLRATINAGGSVGGGLLHAWGVNLLQVFSGGEPLGYLGLQAWPVLAPWAWIPVALGSLAALQRRQGSLLLWPLAVLLVTQCSHSPWGLSPQRLAAAWPAVALLGGLGLERLMDQGTRRVQVLLLCAVALGFGLELHAWFRHMALNGSSLYGRSARLQEAVDELRSPLGQGLPVLSSLYEVHYPELRWHRGLGAAPPAAAAAAVWVLLPPEFRVPAAGLPVESRFWRRSPNEQGAWAIRASGPLARRFADLDAALRPLARAPQGDLRSASDADRAWLRSGRSSDDWGWSAVLQRDLRRIWLGLPMEEAVWKIYASRAPVQPGPGTLLGKALIAGEPEQALVMLDRALALDPDYTPALEARYKALLHLGRAEEAQKARDHWRDRVAAGAWQVYD